MHPLNEHMTIEKLFEIWRSRLGPDFAAYRNHVYRVFHFASEWVHANGDDCDKLAIAAAFHDIGIWLDGTFDYIEPSLQRAGAYLTGIGRAAWVEEVQEMIRQHHKVLPYHGAKPLLVEALRRADWLDVCLLALPTRLPKAFTREVLRKYPRNGFHYCLARLTFSWARHHPLQPLPMFRL